MMARTPDLSCIWSELTSKPSRESISSWLRMRSPPPSVGALLNAASSSSCSGGGVSSAMGMPLLDDHLFEKNVAHLVRRGGGINPAEQFFFQAQYAFRALEIVDAQFAQIGLELIHQARHQSRHAGLFQIVVQFQRQRQFQIGRS